MSWVLSVFCILNTLLSMLKSIAFYIDKRTMRSELVALPTKHTFNSIVLKYIIESNYDWYVNYMHTVPLDLNIVAFNVYVET